MRMRPHREELLLAVVIVEVPYGSYRLYAEQQRRVALEVRRHLGEQRLVRDNAIKILPVPEELAEPHLVFRWKVRLGHEVVELVHRIAEGGGLRVEGGEDAAERADHPRPNKGAEDHHAGHCDELGMVVRYDGSNATEHGDDRRVKGDRVDAHRAILYPF
eukprot:scaffold70461_cov68-Phaeocystis_antarctica.AAC.8